VVDVGEAAGVVARHDELGRSAEPLADPTRGERVRREHRRCEVRGDAQFAIVRMRSPRSGLGAHGRRMVMRRTEVKAARAATDGIARDAR
jgi:hypothetical protein